jgi:hypothetical protein
VLYIADKDHQDQTSRRQLMRVPIDGGPAEVILSGLLWGIRCARLLSDMCLLKESSFGLQTTPLLKLDPAKGRGRELFELDAADDANWDPSPNGTQVALFGVEKPIRIKSLADQTLQEVIPKGWKAMDYVTWANDSRGLYGSSPTQRGDILLHTDLQGTAPVMWERRGSLEHPVSRHPTDDISPWKAGASTATFWMLENF